jgi:heme/copper-type cytochrome/quinol oxidase subunit 3
MSTATHVSAAHPGTIPAAFYSNELGPVAEKRSPFVTFLLSALIPFYGLYWFYFQVMPELKAHLRKSDDEISPMKSMLIGIVTLGIASFFQLAKVARLVAEAHQRAGRNVSSKGTLWVVCALLFAPAVPFLVQGSLNDLWEGRA